MGLALAGLVLVVLPFLTSFSRLIDTILLIGALAVLGTGMGMALDDLGSLRNRPSLKDFAPSVFLAALAAATAVLWGATDASGVLLVVLVVALAFFGLFTCVGVGIGLSKVFAEMAELQEANRKPSRRGRGRSKRLVPRPSAGLSGFNSS